MILAAGLGTRLRPLTNDRPKAMVEVNGMPLLEIAIRRLRHFGYQDIIINVHHFAEKIIDFLEEKNNFGIHIEVSDERAQLLNTGGGLKKAGWFFEDGAPFLLCNTDILSNIDLQQFYDFHVKNGGLATLAIRERSTSRYLVFDDGPLLHGWTNVKSGELRMCRLEQEKLQMWAFSGMHIIDPKLLTLMPKDDAFSIIELYLQACTKNEIFGYIHTADEWLDVGKPETLKKAGVLVDKLSAEWKTIS